MISRTLQQGSTGSDVSQLETKLQSLNLYLGKIDGSFGPVLKSAVINYQKIKGLVQDGIAGPITLTALGLWEAAPTPVKPAPFLQLEKNLQCTINSMPDLMNGVIASWKRNGGVYNHISCMQGATLTSIIAGVNSKYNNCARWAYLANYVALVLGVAIEYIHVDCDSANGQPDFTAGHYFNILKATGTKFDLAHAASSGLGSGTMCINGYNGTLDNNAPCAG